MSSVPGAKVTLTGTNFTGATGVLFNGASVSFTNALPNKLDLRVTAVVPPDATSGPITILTPHSNATTTASFQGMPPPLVVRLSAPNEVEITWPATGSTFVLEVSEDLSAGSWSPVTEPRVVTNLTTTVSLLTPSGHRFYRLKID